MLRRINSIERNINELMELKNTTQELHKAYTSFNSQFNQAEEGYQRLKARIEKKG